MQRIEDLSIKVFADGANLDVMLELYKNPLVKGFTTNPTLMRQAGVSDYESFAKEVLRSIPDRPISFEVFSDDIDEMEAQASQIAAWGRNVYVKIPITNTRGELTVDLVRALVNRGVNVNVTAVMTLEQVDRIASCLRPSARAYISIFAGRIADTGRDPMPIMKTAVEQFREFPKVEFIWASPRELLNIFHADSVGCHIITVTPDVIKKIGLIGKNLDEYSLDTVKMFYEDGRRAGYKLRKVQSVRA